MGEWLSRRDAAAYLAVGIRMIDTLIKEGRIEASYITRGTIRISRYSLERLLQEGKR